MTTYLICLILLPILALYLYALITNSRKFFGCFNIAYDQVFLGRLKDPAYYMIVAVLFVVLSIKVLMYLPRYLFNVISKQKVFINTKVNNHAIVKKMLLALEKLDERLGQNS
jgi:multidrug efflux pump subunit AcrB